MVLLVISLSRLVAVASSQSRRQASGQSYHYMLGWTWKIDRNPFWPSYLSRVARYQPALTVDEVLYDFWLAGQGQRQQHQLEQDTAQ